MLQFIIRKLKSINPPPLGRWCTKDKTKNNWKVDMANIDHCGTCASDKYVLKTKDLKTVAVVEKKKESVYMYY